MGWTPSQIDKMDFKLVEMFKMISTIEGCDKLEDVMEILKGM